MKARRFFAFVASVAMLFAGGACTPDGGDGGANSEMASISVNPASFAVDLEGGEQTIAVTSNGTWVATCLEGDVVITPATGSGDGSVVVTVPTTTAARNFVVKFDVSKQTLIAGTDMVSTTKASAEVTVSQNATGTDANDYLFYENCGDDVEKNSEGYWPYIHQFEGWNPQGDIAAGVKYTGKNASVRASGGNYQPTADAVGVSGQPYVFLNKVPAEAYFVIEDLAVTGGANYIFTFNVSCQNGYSGAPSFATVDNSLVHLELGYDGENWDAVECTYAANGGNGWYAATAQFKVAADATKVYARFSYEAPASNGGGRFDDFKLVEGGTGAELAPEAPVVNQGTIADITAAGNYTVKGAWAVATYANGCLLTDNSGAYILAYNPSETPAVGEVVDIEGAVSEYAKLLQFGAGAVVTKTGETKTVTHPTAEVLDGAKMDAYLGTPVIKYVEYSGVLSISSGKYYNVTVPGASTSQGSVAYPDDALKATLTNLDGKGIKVTGYLIGATSSKYVNTMAVSVEETTVEMPEQPENPTIPEIPVGGTALEITTASVQAGVPGITTNGYGSQATATYSTYLTWDVYAACKLCLPPSGNYATAGCLQMQGNADDAAKQSRIGNVVATPKRITKVIVESWNEKYTPNFNLALGTEQVVGTTVPSNMIAASSMTTASEVVGAVTRYVSTYEVTSGDYNYFAIYKNTSGAFYFTKIRVEYAE
ncbi:MAG: BACON domain-containing protein [Alistipes sp.]|nr:BACON domain-containing protein [Alistipes sp.]